MGTDCPVSPHGTNLREIALMAEHGLGPARALHAATLSAAALLRLDDQLGSIEPGKRADVVVVSGDPLAVPEALALSRAKGIPLEEEQENFSLAEIYHGTSDLYQGAQPRAGFRPGRKKLIDARRRRKLWLNGRGLSRPAAAPTGGPAGLGAWGAPGGVPRFLCVTGGLGITDARDPSGNPPGKGWRGPERTAARSST